MAKLPEFFHFQVLNGLTKIGIQDVSDRDFVEVVRCRDCKYYFKYEDGYEMCENSEGYDHVTEDGFCAWAKMREES